MNCLECRISLCVHCWSTRLYASLTCGSSCFLRVFRSFGGIEWSLGVFGLGYGAVVCGGVDDGVDA